MEAKKKKKKEEEEEKSGVGEVGERSEAGVSPGEGAREGVHDQGGFILDADFPGYCPMNEATYGRYLAVRIANLQVSLDELKESFRSTFGDAGV